ncbi:SCO2102 family sporulation regulator [Streptomyces sp. YKOK-I1]
MGWTVLYIAFGIVALWLLGEVLLQYKARLRWRLLAFVGFLGVVLGVLIPSVIVIGLGAAAFAVGQTYVTLSFRRGFAEGWAVRRGDGEGPLPKGLGKGRRTKDDREDPDLDGAEPGTGSLPGYGDIDSSSFGGDGPVYGQDKGAGAFAEEDYDRDDVFTPAARTAQASAAETTTVYSPQPMPDDTNAYGIYTDSSEFAGAGGQSQDQYATAAQGADQSYGYDGYSGYNQQQYGYDTTGEQQYAAYSDPYIGTQTYGGGSYDGGYDQQQYGQQGHGQDQYGTGATGGYGETPAGGVWVPQQRTDDPFGSELPPEQQQYPYQGDGQQGQQGQQNHGYDDQQYRF